MDPYSCLDYHSAHLTHSVQMLLERVPNSENIEFTTEQIPIENNDYHIIARVPVADGYLYYVPEEFNLVTKTISTGYHDHLDLTWLFPYWEPVPEPTDGVYLDHHTLGARTGAALPWNPMMDLEMWDVVEWYIRNDHIRGMICRIGGKSWYSGMDIKRVILHFSIPKLDEMAPFLPRDIFWIAEKLSTVELPSEKRLWIAGQIVDTEKPWLSHQDQWMEKNAALNNMKLLPRGLPRKIWLHIHSLTRDRTVLNFNQILHKLVRLERVPEDLELEELWDILGITPVYSGNGTKGVQN